MKKLILTLCMTAAAASALSVSASAADYSFETSPQTAYYGSTNYADHYHEQYSYGGRNQCDYDIPEIGYGLSQEFLEHTANNPYLDPNIHYGLEGSDNSGYPTPDYTIPGSGSEVIETPHRPIVTAEALKQKDGSIGTVSVSRVGLSCKVYEGATSDSMNRGAGHYPGSGVWNGNVGLFGHNRGRGVAYFANLKNVKLGDIVTYKTILGTKTYKVNFVGVISRTDFQYLNEMGDDRITLITCVASQPTLRLCVQAVEIR